MEHDRDRRREAVIEIGEDVTGCIHATVAPPWQYLCCSENDPLAK